MGDAKKIFALFPAQLCNRWWCTGQGEGLQQVKEALNLQPRSILVALKEPERGEETKASGSSVQREQTGRIPGWRRRKTKPRPSPRIKQSPRAAVSVLRCGHISGEGSQRAGQMPSLLLTQQPEPLVCASVPAAPSHLLPGDKPSPAPRLLPGSAAPSGWSKTPRGGLGCATRPGQAFF